MDPPVRDGSPAVNNTNIPSARPEILTDDLVEALRSLADLAAKAIPGCDGAGATMMQDGVAAFRSSNRFATVVDKAQYRLDEGPCIDAVRLSQTVVSGTVGSGEDRWPNFCTVTPAMGVRSVLSLPLNVQDKAIGSINVYSQTANAFDAAAIAAGELFAQPAASALSTSQLLVQYMNVAAFAATELTDRAAVETAVGVLVGVRRLSAAAARKVLSERAAASGRTLPSVAHALLAQLDRDHEQS